MSRPRPLPRGLRMARSAAAIGFARFLATGFCGRPSKLGARARCRLARPVLALTGLSTVPIAQSGDTCNAFRAINKGKSVSARRRRPRPCACSLPAFRCPLPDRRRRLQPPRRQRQRRRPVRRPRQRRRPVRRPRRAPSSQAPAAPAPTATPARGARHPLRRQRRRPLSRPPRPVRRRRQQASRLRQPVSRS